MAVQALMHLKRKIPDFFVADWLKSKGLHKLCSVFEGIQEPFIPCLHTQLPKHNRSSWKVSWGGAFDQLQWTSNGAFEQLFGLGRGEFEQRVSKNSNARGGVARGDVYASIWLVHKSDNLVAPRGKRWRFLTGTPRFQVCRRKKQYGWDHEFFWKTICVQHL